MKPEKFIADFFSKHSDVIYHMPSDWDIRRGVSGAKEFCGYNEDKQKRGTFIRIECDDGGAHYSDPAKRRDRGQRMKAVFRIHKPGRFWEAEFIEFENPPVGIGE